MLVRHAITELMHAGVPLSDPNEEIPIGDYVIDLLATYAKQRHTPLTSHVTMQIFMTLSNYWSLTPLSLDEGEFDDNGMGSTYEFNRRDRRIIREKSTGIMFNQEAYAFKIRLLKGFGIDKIYPASANTVTQNGPFYIHKDGKATGQRVRPSSCVIDTSKIGEHGYKVPEVVVLPVIGVEYEKGQHVMFCEENDISFQYLCKEYDMHMDDVSKIKGKAIYDVTFEDLFKEMSDEKE